ncbi:MAG: hypothetical protein LC798_20560, partial [Chloroflexi bacterium]|nr:hypothetical protein [Chloroflexota bacterium]
MDQVDLVTGPDTSADPAGERIDYHYDGARRLERVVFPAGVATASEANDHAVTYSYDKLDRVTKQSRYADPSSLLETHYCYSDAGDLKWLVTPRAGLSSVDCGAASPPSNTWRFGYDAAHQKTLVTDPEGDASSVTYDPNGNADSFTDELANKTTQVFDERDRVTKTVAPFNADRTITTRYVYDGFGNLARVISPRAHDTDPNNPTRYVTDYAYDGLNRLTKTTLPNDGTAADAGYMHRTYDANGNLTATSLPVAQANPDEVADDNWTTLTYYDPGWIRSQDVDPDPQDTIAPEIVFNYSAQGWQIERVPRAPDGSYDTSKRVRWIYYPDGMLRGFKDRDGNYATHRYNANNMLTAASDLGGAEREDRQVQLNVGYDWIDRATRVEHRYHGADAETFSAFSYDSNGNVVASDTDGEQNQQGTVTKTPHHRTFTYYPDDRPNTATDDRATPSDATDDVTVTSVYDDAGREVTRDVLKGTSVKQRSSWGHFDNGQIETIRMGRPGQPTRYFATLDYVSDGAYANGNVTRNVYRMDKTNCTAADNCEVRYVYDARDRVVTYDDGHDNNTSTATTYTLDVHGNVTVKDPAVGDSTFYGYDGDRLTEATTGSSTTRYFYDVVGTLACAMTSSGTAEQCDDAAERQDYADSVVEVYAYDPLERLVGYKALSDGTVDKTASYTYDALDRLVEHEEDRDLSGSPVSRDTTFGYLGLSKLMTQETISGTGGTESKTKTYSYSGDGSRVALTQSGGTDAGTYFYGYDFKGSVATLMADDTGTLKATYAYDPYGAPDPASTVDDPQDDDPLNPYRYDGRRFDTATQSLDMGARVFDSSTTRFLQRDYLLGALDDMSLSTDPINGTRYALGAGNP